MCWTQKGAPRKGWMVPKHRSSWITQGHRSAIPKRLPLVTPMLAPRAIVAHKASVSWGPAGPVTPTKAQPCQQCQACRSLPVCGKCLQKEKSQNKLVKFSQVLRVQLPFWIAEALWSVKLS